ncbi:GNAT family N-acetyltransferase [Aquimarina sp. ERC-38]|uniref:GNAT family N-acetyltransferase n=1 Tax=Aquimarina sp. ERC-38 TaxID=2949996 RepID=UPI002245DFBD|nr:GNAT family N-acetyltransferase [Aquimarina sp. ERC-38]UZO79610.1 GNAT family N-acetyltransferase [Aquimarina sp. ERC-38]
MEKYLFKSKRLGFRNWTNKDKLRMSEINSDPQVMEFFPGTLSKEQTEGFIDRMKKQYVKSGFCYFAVDKLENSEFIGFIGISEQNFKADFTPCVDIGWRLAPKEWGKGYATEGARKCLDFAFKTIGLKSINSICPEINHKSKRVIEKLGMKKVQTFKHPLLKDYKTLESCVLYELKRK